MKDKNPAEIFWAAKQSGLKHPLKFLLKKNAQVLHLPSQERLRIVISNIQLLTTNRL